ncbi:DUF7146 domain-containing protein [Falsiroseomonas oryziterrae]|uniref:DUF7146 domain-containing protein n=1 Tax=Falsiroseomonas oryziterrae TaxID=2911368 RepID=UPI001F2B5154|nr:toprim domain-containing protein [Roseomonas sp. NPKOSM-4]
MTDRPDLATVNARLTERMDDLAQHLAGEPSSRSRDELRFRGKGSLSVMIAGPKRGIWHDYEASCGGDPLGLVAHLRRTPMRDAYAWALAWLGEFPHHRHPATRRAPVAPPEAPHGASQDVGDLRKQWSVAKAGALWRDAVPGHDMLRAYLAARGLTLPEDAPLRFHPRAWRNAEYGPHGPAMVALMTLPETGEPCGAHVTYLRADGAGKAEGQRQKVMLGAAGVIRLVPDADVSTGLGLAEGIETALAVMQRAGWSPVWAATSAGAMDRFPVLPGIEALTIFADADGAGIKAARACGRRWAAAGREARLLAPPAGDWNDALPRVGEAA